MGVGFTCVKHMIPWFHGKSRVGKEQSQVEGNRFHEIEKPGEGGFFFPNINKLWSPYVRHKKSTRITEWSKTVTFPFYYTCCSKTVLKVQCNIEKEIRLSETIAVFVAKALDTIVS